MSDTTARGREVRSCGGRTAEEAAPLAQGTRRRRAGSGFRLALYNALKPIVDAGQVMNLAPSDMAQIYTTAVNDLADVINDQVKTGTAGGDPIV